MEAYICSACGVQYPPASAPPRLCLICSDERQFVPAPGQGWTTLTQMQGKHHNRLVEVEPDLFRIDTEPRIAIGQSAFLVRTGQGNLLWDCLSYLDLETVAGLERLGGVAAIAISHPHFYGCCVEYSRAFGGAPVHLSRADLRYLMRPDPAVLHFDGDSVSPLPGVTVVRLGGHFQGSSVLHWPEGAGGGGVLLSGDTIAVAADRDWVSFAYSYPNRIPLPAPEVRWLADRVSGLQYDRLYGAWPGELIPARASERVQLSAARYLAMLEGSWPRS